MYIYMHMYKRHIHFIFNKIQSINVLLVIYDWFDEYPILYDEKIINNKAVYDGHATICE